MSFNELENLLLLDPMRYMGARVLYFVYVLTLSVTLRKGTFPSTVHLKASITWKMQCFLHVKRQIKQLSDLLAARPPNVWAVLCSLLQKYSIFITNPGEDEWKYLMYLHNRPLWWRCRETGKVALFLGQPFCLTRETNLTGSNWFVWQRSAVMKKYSNTGGGKEQIG